MHPTQTSEKLKTPRLSHGIPWLGGASFGRSPRREAATTPHDSYGTFPLILLNATMVATFALQEVLGVWLCIAATIGLIVLCGVWLRRYYETTVPFFRWAAVASLTLQLLFFLPAYIYMLIHSSPPVSIL